MVALLQCTTVFQFMFLNDSYCARYFVCKLMFVLVIKRVHINLYWYKDGVVPSNYYMRTIGFSICILEQQAKTTCAQLFLFLD